MKKTIYVCDLCNTESIGTKIMAMELCGDGKDKWFIKLHKDPKLLEQTRRHICSRCIGNIVVFVQKKETDNE